MRDVTIVLVAAVGIAAALIVFARPVRLADAAASADSTPSAGAEPASTWIDGSVSIVVPARDEARSLPVLLRSLVQDHPSPLVGEIIVVDDQSTDRTAEVGRSFATTVIRTTDLPGGWVGKNWACATGASAASGTHLLFLDADVRIGAGAIDEVAAVHRRLGGMVSVQPYHRVERPYEELSAMFNAVAVLGSGCFTPRPSSARAAFGPCLLISREDYERVGGHAAVRAEVVEDIALAIRCRQAGVPVSSWLGGRSMSFRMYPASVRELVQGWTKNIAMGARLAAPAPVLATVVWVVALAAAASAMITGMWAWAGGGGPPVAALGAWAAMVLHLRWVLARLGSFRTLTAVVYVVPLGLFVAIFLRSAWRAVRRADVVWRGRSVSSRARVKGDATPRPAGEPRGS